MTRVERGHTRTLHATLISCLFTLAVSLASWWGDPAYMLAERLNLNSSLVAVVITLVCPFAPFLNILCHLLRVLYASYTVFRFRRLQQTDDSTRRNVFVSSRSNPSSISDCPNRAFKWLRAVFKEVGIMSVCPIVIPIPQDLSEENESKIETMKRSKGCRMLEAKELKALRPLVMMPEAGSDGLKGYYDAISGRRFGTKAAEAEAEDHRRHEAQSAPEAVKYMYFNIGGHACKWRMVLLKRGLVPPYDQLRYLRTRSRFQALITFLQTLGFMLGLAQRLDEGLALSSLELLVSYYAIMALLHVGLDLCTCVSFQTAILLSLSPRDFEAFLRAADPVETTPSSLQGHIIAGSTTVAYVLVFSTAAMFYYRIHYCHVASWATTLVFPLFISQQAAWILLVFCSISIIVSCKLFSADSAQHRNPESVRNPTPRRLSIRSFLLLFVSSVSAIVSVAVPVVSIVGTVNDWELFKQAPQENEVAWIVAKWKLPHVSSGD